MTVWYRVTVELPSYATRVVTATDAEEAAADARRIASEIYAEVERLLEDYGSPIDFGQQQFEIVEMIEVDPEALS